MSGICKGKLKTMTVYHNYTLFEFTATVRHLNLFWGPGVKVHRLDTRDVHPEVPVDTSTAYAHEDTQIPTGPSRTCEQDGML